MKCKYLFSFLTKKNEKEEEVQVLDCLLKIQDAKLRQSMNTFENEKGFKMKPDSRVCPFAENNQFSKCEEYE